MTRASRFFRTFALIFAFAQYAMAGVFAVSDGLEAMQGKDAVSHIESHSSSHCPKVHSDDCVVCQFLAGNTLLAPRREVVLPIVHTVIAALPVATNARNVGAYVYHPLLPRAPPVVG